MPSLRAAEAQHRSTPVPAGSGPAHPLFGPFAEGGAEKVSMAVVEAAGDGRPCARPAWFDAVVVSVQLVDTTQRRSWEDGSPGALNDLTVGDTIFHDLRRGPQILLDAPYGALNIHIPRAAFDRVAEQAKAGPFTDLSYEVGAPVRDEVIWNIVQTLRPTLGLPGRGGGLFVEQLTVALATHIAHAHGGLIAREAQHRGGLAPWQMRRAKEALLANLNAKVSLEEVARACDLSRSHFSRSFRQSFGEAPYQFILKARVEAAKIMIRERTLAMAEISLACGFADQSHMTRVFSREVGVSPVAWRRTGLD
jgi:AraC family transcriptional regulator